MEIDQYVKDGSLVFNANDACVGENAMFYPPNFDNAIFNPQKYYEDPIRSIQILKNATNDRYEFQGDKINAGTELLCIRANVKVHRSVIL